jgi:hypothetical protein
MRLSDERIKSLQELLKEYYGLKYSTEQAQDAGLAIMRFVLAKQQRAQEIRKDDYGKGNEDDNQMAKLANN